jgi:plastocyanin
MIAVRSLLLVGLVMVVLAACGDSDDSGSSGPPTTAPIVITDQRGNPAVDVEAKDDFFDPSGIQIDVGTTVTWRNVGQNVHNVLPMNDVENFGPTPFGVQTNDFPTGATYAYTFGTPGTFNYTCTIHTGMNGRVIVG